MVCLSNLFQHIAPVFCAGNFQASGVLGKMLTRQLSNGPSLGRMTAIGYTVPIKSLAGTFLNVCVYGACVCRLPSMLMFVAFPSDKHEHAGQWICKHWNGVYRWMPFKVADCKAFFPMLNRAQGLVLLHYGPRNVFF